MSRDQAKWLAARQRDENVVGPQPRSTTASIVSLISDLAPWVHEGLGAVAEALHRVVGPLVDVAQGVEEAPGVLLLQAPRVRQAAGQAARVEAVPLGTREVGVFRALAEVAERLDRTRVEGRRGPGTDRVLPLGLAGEAVALALVVGGRGGARCLVQAMPSPSWPVQPSST